MVRPCMKETIPELQLFIKDHSTMKVFIVLMIFGVIAWGKQAPKRDISNEIGVFASLRPFSMLECVVQCSQNPNCNSVLLEEETKTCLLNRHVAKGQSLTIKGYKYSEKADPTKPERSDQCTSNAFKELETCLNNQQQSTTIRKDQASKPTVKTTTTTKAPGTLKASVITTRATPTTPITQQPCPDHYLSISKFDPPICYRIDFNSSNFDDAVAKCSAEGSVLILPDSLERLTAVNEAIFDAAKGKTAHHIWIDASRSSHLGSWKTSGNQWVDYDVFLMTNWDQHLNKNDGNCLAMLFTPPRNMSGWVATKCSERAWFICTPDVSDVSSDNAYDDNS